MFKRIFSFALIVLAVSGCGTPPPAHTPADTTAPQSNAGAAKIAQSPIVSTEFFTYTDTKQGTAFTQKKVAINTLFTAESLKNQNDQCETKKTYDYFLKLFSKFLPTDTATDFAFGPWHVYVVLNRPGYKSTDEFKKDFAVCGSVGSLTPALSSSRFLLFTSICPSGSSTVAQTCASTQSALLGTFKLK